jgi:hypothetical protein
MRVNKVLPGAAIELSVQVLRNGNGETGEAANTKVCVQRLSDGYYLKWIDSTWTTPFAAADHEVAMTERATGSGSGEAGYYYKAWTVPLAFETYRVSYFNTTYVLDEAEEVIADEQLMAEQANLKYAISYDFTTYYLNDGPPRTPAAVMLFWNADRPLAGDPIAWRYIYTSAGAKPSNTSEVALCDRLNLWAEGSPPTTPS